MSSINDIQGTNCRFQILVGDDYLDFICAKNFRIAMLTDTKETTTPGSGLWKEFRPKKLSYTLAMSGLVQVIEEENRPVFAGLMESQKGFLPVDFRLLYIDNSDNPLVLRGRVYITSNEITADPINLLDGSVQMIGTGELHIEYEIPVFIDMTVQVTGIANAKCKFILINEDGEQVYNTDALADTQANGGWLIQGQTVTFNVLTGNYYWAMVTQDVNSDDNEFDLNTPSPGPVNIEFDHNPTSASSYPDDLHDFTANRSAVFTIGDELPPPPCIDVSIFGSPELPDGEVGIPYSYSFALAGSQPFGLTINSRPSWMTIEISGDTVNFSGTPDVDGSDIDVDITITNCSAGSVNLTDTIDIEPASPEQSLIEWTFTEISGHGSIVIRRNSAIIASAFVDASGSFNALPGDVIIAVVASGGPNMRVLVVSADPGGIIYNNSDSTNQSFTFNAASGVNYEITGSIEIV